MIEVDFPPLKKIINEAFIPLFKNTDRYLLLWGGRGSSKSNFAAKKLIYDCLNEPYFRYILVRDTYASIKDSQYQTIKDIVNELGLSSLFHFKENPLEIRCKNGNIIYARGCDDVDKIKSIKDPSGAWYEEANNIRKEDFLTITTSIRTGKARFLQEILTFNPETNEEPDLFWINQMFLSKSSEKIFRGHLSIKAPSGEELKTSFTAHHSTYHDNRWCSPEFIAFLEQLLKEDPYYYDVFCLGIWGTKKATNPFAHQYDPKKHESTQSVFDPNKQIAIFVDFNTNPMAMTYSHIWIDGKGRHHHQFGEDAVDFANINKAVQVIKDKFDRWIQGAVLGGDMGGKKGDMGHKDNWSFFKQMLSGLGMSESQLKVAANPRHIKSRTDVNKVLAHHPDFKINPDTCPRTCRDFRTVQCDNYGEIIKQNRNDPDQKADFLDACRYRINIFEREFIDKKL